MSNNNYPPNSHYMPQMSNQQMQQQMQQQQQSQQHAMYGMPMQMGPPHGMHKMPDGTMQPQQHQHMMMQQQQQPNIGQRPQQRVMMMSPQQHQHYMQQQRANMQMQQQKNQIRMIGQPQAMPTSQVYYAAGPGPRNIAQSPMKVSQQMSVRADGMRPQQVQTGHIIRQGSYEAMQFSQAGGVIVQQQQMPQTSHISQPGGPQYIRAALSQGGPIRTRQPTQIIRTHEGTRCIVRPPDQGGQYIIRQAYNVPSSSNEQPQYQIVNQGYIHQTANQGQIRSVRPVASQQQQPQPMHQQPTPLQMALTSRPVAHVVSTQNNAMMQPAPIMVIQQGMPNQQEMKPMVVDQTGAEIRVMHAPQQTQIIRQQMPQGIQMKQVPIQKPVTVPFSAPAPAPAKSTPNKTPAKTPAKKSKSKAKVVERQPVQPKMADTSDAMGTATAKSKLISAPNFERILTEIGINDAIDNNAKNALAEFAEVYADELITQLVAAAKHRKAVRIENKDAVFVLSQERRRENPNEFKKR